MTPTPSSPAAMGMEETAGIATSPRSARWECPEPVAKKGMIPLRVRVEKVPHLPTAVGKSTPADPRRDADPNGETRTPTTTWDSARMPTHPAAEGPPDGGPPGPSGGGPAGGPPGGGPPGRGR